MTTRMPGMTPAQTAAWRALMDLYDKLPNSWTLVGGQMVQLHCVERGVRPTRPTTDADALQDVQGRPEILLSFTTGRQETGFESAGESPEGHQHRWIMGDAQIDVLIPSTVGERAAKRKGATGGTTLETPAGKQALARSEVVEVEVDGRVGYLRRPNLIGALVSKAAAHTIFVDPDKGRHRSDFAMLASLVTAGDLRAAQLKKRDKKYLRPMIAATKGDAVAMAISPHALLGLERLELIVANDEHT